MGFKTRPVNIHLQKTVYLEKSDIYTRGLAARDVFKVTLTTLLVVNTK